MASFEEFWTLVVGVWQTGFLGIDIGRGVTALGIFALFLIFRELFARFVLANIERLTRKSETTLDDRIAEALKDPLRFVPVVAGAFFALDYLNMEPEYVQISGNLVRSLVAFNIFWALYRVIGPISFVMHKLNNVLGEVMVEWLIKAIHGLTIFIGGATILEMWGIQVGPLLAGLGLFGVAVALGAQDRLLATGVTRRARVVLVTASVTETPLAKTKGLTGTFTIDQVARYDATAEMRVEIVTDAGVVEGRANAIATRSQTVPEDITLNQRDEIWFEMAEALMRDLDDQLVKNIHLHFGRWIR